MVVTIKLFPLLRKRLPSSDRCLGGGKWDVPTGATLGHVLELLHLSDMEAQIFFVNDKIAKKDQVLQEGDELQVLPAIGGG